MQHEADLLGLGQHCSRPDCQQLDFLPFKCDACNLTYCLDHRSYGAHSCAVAPATKQLLVIVCPICAASVHLKPGEDPNEGFERHGRAGGCDPRNYQRVHQRPRCPAKGCKEKLTSINTYSCKSCRQQVCMKHRHTDDHQCIGRPTGAAAPKRQAAASVHAAAAATATAAASAAASVGAQAMGLVGRLGLNGSVGNGGNRGSGSAAGARRSAAANDPNNSVMGTAERRRQLLEQQRAQQQAGGGSSWLPVFAQRQPPAAAAAAAATGGVIDLTGDDESMAGAPHTRQQQQQQQDPGQRPAVNGAEFSCHRCGMGFSDPVELVEHDARCAAANGRDASGSGLGARASNCRLS